MSLDRIDQSLTAGTSPRWVLPVLFVATLATFLAYYQWKFGLNGPPSTSGDEVEYDAIGWELAHGRRFQIDPNDRAFREPYDRAAKSNPARFGLGGLQPGTVVNRPPLFPGLIALTDVLFGRQFWVVRFVNAATMAGVCVCLFWFVRRWKGGVPACAGAALFVAADERSRLYGRAILTEATSAVLVALLCLALLTFKDRPSWRSSAAAAVCFGLAILDRTMIVLWSPVMLWLVWRIPRGADDTKPVSNRLTILFAGVTGAILLPWMIRNCVVTGRFMPLGTQGQTQLPGGYSDLTWDNRGVWINQASRGFFADVDQDDQTNVERHVARAEFSKQRAFEWIAAHPGKTVALGGLKVAQEFRPRTIPQGVILLLAVIGAVAWRSEPETRILLRIALACTLAIAVTWSVEGRFLVPILFVEHTLAAAGIAKLVVLGNSANQQRGPNSSSN